ncbi:hypothetical protein [Methylobacterium sp. E-066]|uniref:hypothetical protein n=1 Tax=Methylobacterium sp. E-066 TaxID=2836584 RepID=UPI001FB8913F|nr:hypothetical protein [Methylobacterium sp. E-066]MCJ2143640.1 hypothetical protein [Methylobacterium sp. E-066]
MPPEIPTAPQRCTACDRGHYVPVRFCPFCGAEQMRPKVEPPAPPPPPPPPPPSPMAQEAAPAGPVAAPMPPPEPPVEEPPPAAAHPPPIPSVHPNPRRRKRLVRLRQAVLALAAIVGLAALALARRDVVPAPTRIEVGPAWTAVALKSFRNVASLRITAEGVVSLRIDGERVQRVSPSSGATVRPKTLRSLELRAGRGSVTVTLTPRGE